MINLRDKTVAIVGVQKSGIAAAELALALGAQVKMTDASPSVSSDVVRWAESKGIDLETGEHTFDFIRTSDYVVTSPGVPIHADILMQAKAQGICVLGEIEFAFQFAASPVIAVTGSNGKTTVATLIHELLIASGRTSVLCGNIGTPFSEVVLASPKPDYFVVEVSSFQLESLLDHTSQVAFHINGFCPYIAVLLNINQNHLDRHKDMEEYAQAKLRIFLNQDATDYAIINANLLDTPFEPEDILSKKMIFNEQEKVVNPNKQVIDVVADILSIDQGYADSVYSEFKGVEHRMEYVASVAGVDFINDSKSTTIESGRWALRNMAAPVVLLCGGRDKNLDFQTIATDVCDRVKAVIVYGESGGKIANAFKAHPRLCQADDLRSAFQIALDFSEEGDQVLLSPMCASFDAFSNFEERGQFFKDLVYAYKNMKQDALNA